MMYPQTYMTDTGIHILYALKNAKTIQADPHSIKDNTESNTYIKFLLKKDLYKITHILVIFYQ